MSKKVLWLDSKLNKAIAQVDKEIRDAIANNKSIDLLKSLEMKRRSLINTKKEFINSLECGNNKAIKKEFEEYARRQMTLQIEIAERLEKRR